MARRPSPILGAAIAAAMALYAIAADRRERRQVAKEIITGERGRAAEHPIEISPPGWWDILKRVFADISRRNISLMAAGIAFYALLSLAPAFTALVALYGLVFDPAQVQQQVTTIEGLVPEEGRRVIADQLTTIVQASNSTLSIGFVISLGVAIWSATAATTALMSALNVIYHEEEKRSFLRYYANALALTAAGVVFALLALVLVAIIPAVLGLIPLGELGRMLVSWVRWPVLLLLFSAGFAVIYRYAPSRNEARWDWVNGGAIAATLLWIAGSALFSFYVGSFATYNKTYGSLGAVVVLLIWFWMSAYAVLLGAALNAEAEHQTAADTTRPPKKPMGWRGAYVADTVAVDDGAPP
jgi:membrane protein